MGWFELTILTITCIFIPIALYVAIFALRVFIEGIKWKFFLLRIIKQCGGKIAGRFLFSESIYCRIHGVDMEAFPSSSCHGTPFPMNIKIVSEKEIFTLSDEHKKQMITIGEKYGVFNVECDMRYLKVFSGWAKDKYRELKAMVNASLAMYEYAKGIEESRRK